MKKIAVLSAALFLIAGSGHGDDAQSVSARKGDDRIVVDVAGETFTEYLFGKEHKYPFFYPVIGPTSGRSVTAWDQEPYPHHSSLYISLDNVRSENVSRGNYWQPRDRLETGHVLSRNAQILEDDQKRVVLRDEADWIVPAADSHQLKDTRTVTIWAPSPTIRIMDFEFVVEALKDLEIRQTGHSFFSARMRPEIAVGDQDGNGRGPRDVQEMGTGTLVDSRGNKNESEAQKTTADWCAYYGKNNGATEGLAIIQHSDNPFYPASWFVRDYGFMSPSPFSFDGDRKIKAGETLIFRYRVVVFTGTHETANIAHWRDKFEDAF